MTQYWLLKTEPSTYSIADLEREGRTTWDGVKNALALIHLRAMRPGDGLLLYHSGKEKAVVGRALVDSAPRTEGTSTAVEVRFEAQLRRPVTLAELKAERDLAGLPLIRNTRLSVMPVTEDEWEAVHPLAGAGGGEGQALPKISRKR
ncbi:MAG TPA: EVE domain-containing protein [Gemmatimonadales bacterium]|nr:EVE domain-containing protein [Gemmatimonadales bacterium]